jgi:hypothetical protein
MPVQGPHPASPDFFMPGLYGLVVLSRWEEGLGAAVATLAACVLVILDVLDPGLRRWWDDHALTTDTVAGLLVLMITLLVVDQVVRRRQASNRSRAVAVQVAILMTQANRATQAVSLVLAGPGDQDIAFEDFRTFTMMLLTVAPLLLDDKTSRHFLERVQHLDGEMARALSMLAGASDRAAAGNAPAARLDQALREVRSASTPLLQSLTPDVRSAVRGDDPS